MPGKIPSEFIDQLLSRIDIRDLVERRLSLRKSGRSYLGLCPFHHEKTPSFTVNPERQTYHCFGCGVHGTAISFLMELDRLSFPEAIEELAHQAGMEMPNRDLASPGVPDMEPLRRILRRRTPISGANCASTPDRSKRWTTSRDGAYPAKSPPNTASATHHQAGMVYAANWEGRAATDCAYRCKRVWWWNRTVVNMTASGIESCSDPGPARASHRLRRPGVGG